MVNQKISQNEVVENGPIHQSQIIEEFKMEEDKIDVAINNDVEVSMAQTTKCEICLEDEMQIEEATMLYSCEHVFHTECLKMYL